MNIHAPLLQMQNLKLSTRVIITVISWLIYIIIFLALHSLFGEALLGLGMLPTLITAWLFGFRASIGVTLFHYIVSVALTALTASFVANFDMVARRWPGAIGIGVICLLAGILSDLFKKLQQDQVSLQQDKQNLDQRIQERTIELANTNAALHLALQETRDSIQSKKEMQESQARLAALVASSDDAIISQNPDAIITSWNQGAEKLYGYTAEEMIGHRFSEVLPEEQGKEAKQIYQRLQKGERIRSLETIRRHKDGHDINILLSISPVRDTNGTQIGISFIARDIRERQAMENRLRQQNAYLTTLHQVTLGLVNSLDVNSLLQAIVTQAGALLEAENGYVELPLPMRDKAHIVAAIGNYISMIGIEREIHAGLSGKVWQSGRPFAIDDYMSWEERIATIPFNIYASVTVPMKSNGEMVGAINLSHSKPDRKFSPDEIDILNRFAELASLALYNARLFEQAQNEIAERRRAEQNLQQRIDEISFLYQMGLALTSGEDLYNALRGLVKELRYLMVIDAFHVGLYDETTHIFKYSLFLNLDEDSQPPPRDLRSNPGLTWEVISSRQTLYLTDICDPDIQKEHQIVWIREVDMHSYIGIPLVVGERVVGVMSVQALAPAAYTPEQVRFLETLAAQVAITVEKSRLFTNVQQRAAELATMNEIGRTVSTLQNLDSVFEVIYQQVKQIASADVFYIGLYDSENDRISFPLVYDMGVRYNESAVTLKTSAWIEIVLRTSRPFLLHRIPDEVLETPFHLMGDVKRRSASILVVPLWLGQKVFGVLSIQSYAYNAYSEEVSNILTGIGHQAAIAIENSRLFTNLQQELAERQRAEAQLQISLKEKEVLIKEVHHRVKNNMQVIVSMINLQSSYIEDQHVLDTFRDTQSRVRAMALVHEKLYQSDNLAQIDFGDYLQHLAASLFSTYRSSTNPIKLNIEVAEIKLGVDLAIPCGLIVNELISNTLKYAFPDQSPGELAIQLRERAAHQLELIVADNGVGLPPQIDFEQTETLGMQLIRSLTFQIKGSVELDRKQGTKFTILFPKS